MGKKFINVISDALQEDLVSYGEFNQLLEDAREGRESMQDALRQLLHSDIEIGSAVRSGGAYVKFIAWQGSAESRIDRAMRSVEACNETDTGFAFWLCLRSNVDEYEKAS